MELKKLNVRQQIIINSIISVLVVSLLMSIYFIYDDYNHFKDDIMEKTRTDLSRIKSSVEETLDNYVPHCQVNCNDFFQNTSNGVSQPKHFLGIKLILIITSSTTLFVNDEKSVPLGKYLLNIPLVCSLVPLSHE